MDRNIYDAIEDFLDLVDSPAQVAKVVVNCYFEDQFHNKNLSLDRDEMQDLQCLVNFLLDLEQIKKQK